MAEVGELHVNESRAEVVTQLEVNGVELTILKASPQHTMQLESTAEPIWYTQGHNPRPKKDDDIARTGHDIGILADETGSDVYSVVRGEAYPDGFKLVHDPSHPDEVALTKLHQAKAQENLAAIMAMRESGALSEQPLDIMGFSDGGIVTLAMLDAQPELFGRFVVTNTPGLDTNSRIASHLQGVSELKSMATYNARQRLAGAVPRLSFSRDSQDTDPVKSRKEGNAGKKSLLRFLPPVIVEGNSIAKTKSLLHLLPSILERNPDLRGYIVGTPKDRVAPIDPVEQELASILPGDQRVVVKKTDWEVHAMGYAVEERSEKLGDQARSLLELREQPAALSLAA